MERKSGIMLSEIAFANMPVMLKNSGFDFFIIDCEHGGFDYKEVAQIVMVAKLSGIKAYIRLPDNTRRDIIKFLDMGAAGLLLPMTNHVSDIKQVVEYAKYAPLGKRGISTMRAHTQYNPSNLPEYMAYANNNVEVFAQIETKTGLANVQNIVNCDGVAGVFLGPNDLSCDLNCTADSEEILSATEKLANAALSCKKVSGIITANEKLLKNAYKSGMSIFCVGSELSILKQGAQNIKKLIDNLQNIS